MPEMRIVLTVNGHLAAEYVLDDALEPVTVSCWAALREAVAQCAWVLEW